MKRPGQVLIVLWCVYITLITGQTVSPEDEMEAKQVEMMVKTYPNFFIRRREEQKSFVKKLISYEYEKQYKMLEKAYASILKMLEVEQEPLMQMDLPKKEELPMDKEEFKKVVLVIENICLIGDIVLHLPAISYRIFNKHHPTWKYLIEFGFSILNRYKFVLDDNTLEMLYLFDQEINPEKRSEDFTNPYAKDDVESSQKAAKTEKAKKPKRRGPALRGGEL